MYGSIFVFGYCFLASTLLTPFRNTAGGISLLDRVLSCCLCVWCYYYIVFIAAPSARKWQRGHINIEGPYGGLPSDMQYRMGYIGTTKYPSTRVNGRMLPFETPSVVCYFPCEVGPKQLQPVRLKNIQQQLLIAREPLKKKKKIGAPCRCCCRHHGPQPPYLRVNRHSL